MKIDMLIFSIFAIVAFMGVVVALVITVYKENKGKTHKKIKKWWIRQSFRSNDHWNFYNERNI